jgi:hypothetical protein
MGQQRLAGHRMQDLRHPGPHPRALAGRKYDGKAGSCGHPNPYPSQVARAGRRHKAFFDRWET